MANEKFMYDENLIPYTATGSMVLRLEHLLAGKSFIKMNLHAQNLYNLFIEYYAESLERYNQQFARIAGPTKEDNEYFEVINSYCNMPSEALKYEEKKLIFEYYEAAVTAIEEGKVKVSLAPTKSHLNYEHFSLDDLTQKDSTLKMVQQILKEIIVEPKYFFISNRIFESKMQLNFMKDCMQNKLCFAVSREVLFEHYDEIYDILHILKRENKIIELVIDDDGDKVEKNTKDRRIPYTYSELEMKKIGRISRTLGARIFFSEFYTENFMPYNRKELWGFKEVMKANFYRHNFVNHAKALDLSSFEKVIAISEYLTEHKYAGQATANEKTRTFLTAEDAKTEDGRKRIASSGKGFVCTSFASFAKALIDEFKDEKIECKFINVTYFDRDTRRKKLAAVHAILLVKIKDEKYGLDGYYMWDPTWNSGNGGLTHCLFPVADIENYLSKGSIIDEDLTLPKSMVYLYPPRSEFIEKTANNHQFHEKYGAKSAPIKAKTYEKALKAFYTKAKTSKKFADFLSSKDMLTKSVDELVGETMNTTFSHITSFEPDMAVSDFYELAREYIKLNCTEFEDWSSQDVWREKLKNIGDYKIIMK